ncbi:MAG: hypothetical protein QXY50_05075 [Candidatus Caldarchaeum sp.]
MVAPVYSQQPPPYIQRGFVFVYQVVDLQKQQLENLFHRYIIESVSPQAITVAIQSDVMRPTSLNVKPNGEIQPGVRIDLWIPLDLSPGTRFKFGGVDVVVAQKGLEMQGIKLTIVASTDQSTFWMFIEDGPEPFSRLKGLLLGVIFGQKKGLQLVNIEQSGAVASTSTYTTPVTTRRTTAVATTRTTVVQERTETVTETAIETLTRVETRVETIVATTTVSTTATVQAEVQPPSSAVFPLPVAVGVSAGIIGATLFFTRARKRPLPPTYPYPVYAPPSSTYQQPPPPPPSIVGYCPACRFPVYAGDFACRRCGYRFA